MWTMRQTSISSTTSTDDLKYVGMDERKRKKMISNRDAARRSRVRKLKMLEDLSTRVTRLQVEKKLLSRKVDAAAEGYAGIAAENNVLRAQVDELTERLRSLNSLIDGVGLDLNAPALPDQSSEPWHLPCPLQPIMATFNLE